jgi:hypothetical protein
VRQAGSLVDDGRALRLQPDPDARPRETRGREAEERGVGRVTHANDAGAAAGGADTLEGGLQHLGDADAGEGGACRTPG